MDQTNSDRPPRGEAAVARRLRAGWKRRPPRPSGEPSPDVEPDGDSED